MSLQFDVGEKSRKVAKFIGKVHRELQRALEYEKKNRRITQQQIASLIGVNRSVINREFLGGGNLTLRRLAELAWALGWEIGFELRKPTATHGQNHLPVQAPTTVTSGNVHVHVSSLNAPVTKSDGSRAAA
jgi:hypothetical protein